VTALMASGMAVRSDDPFEGLQRQHRKTWALDMEAAAFYLALRAFPGMDGLVVKGVVDYADLSKDDAFHDFAAHASAIYLLTFIQEYVTADMPFPPRSAGSSQGSGQVTKMQPPLSIPSSRPYQNALSARNRQSLIPDFGTHESSQNTATDDTAISGGPEVVTTHLSSFESAAEIPLPTYPLFTDAVSIFCSHCGHQISVNQAFCGHCGTLSPLERNEQNTTPILDTSEAVQKSTTYFVGTPTELHPEKSAGVARQDWGEAPDVPLFFGRTKELILLEQWIIEDRCRLVTIVGMRGIGKTRLSVKLGRGGIGKTDLSLKLARGIQDKFEYVIWRSLLNAPKATDILRDLIQFLSNQQDVSRSHTVDKHSLKNNFRFPMFFKNLDTRPKSVIPPGTDFSKLNVELLHLLIGNLLTFGILPL
jgi:hypothetical protein